VTAAIEAETAKVMVIGIAAEIITETAKVMATGMVMKLEGRCNADSNGTVMVCNAAVC
jgi:hypothetical protein